MDVYFPYAYLQYTRLYTYHPYVSRVIVSAGGARAPSLEHALWLGWKIRGFNSSVNDIMRAWRLFDLSLPLSSIPYNAYIKFISRLFVGGDGAGLMSYDG